MEKHVLLCSVVYIRQTMPEYVWAPQQCTQFFNTSQKFGYTVIFVSTTTTTILFA